MSRPRLRRPSSGNLLSRCDEAAVAARATVPRAWSAASAASAAERPLLTTTSAAAKPLLETAARWACTHKMLPHPSNIESLPDWTIFLLLTTTSLKRPLAATRAAATLRAQSAAERPLQMQHGPNHPMLPSLLASFLIRVPATCARRASSPPTRAPSRSALAACASPLLSAPHLHSAAERPPQARL